MRRGFTLIEILITLAIFSLIISTGLAINFNSYRSILLDSEVKIFIHILEQSRNRALANYNTSSQSVLIRTSDYVLFSATDFNPSNIFNEYTKRNQAVTVSGPEEITFLSESATTASSTYIFSYENHSKVISIIPDGSIQY
jgi:prepilin-type N-terminal cleavage/methylation domain-containing protein